MFPPTSRYAAVEIAHYASADGRDHSFLRRRFLPLAPATATIAEHKVAAGERLDNITAKYYGDPTQFWRLCDANLAVHPRELTAEIGRRVIIPLPQGS